MDKLIITVALLQTILILMGTLTLNQKLKSLEGQIREKNRYTNYIIVGQAKKILKEVEERGQFIDKSLGTLTDKVGGKAHDHRRKKMGGH